MVIGFDRFISKMWVHLSTLKSDAKMNICNFFGIVFLLYSTFGILRGETILSENL